MPLYIVGSEVEDLTKEEKQWCQKLEKLLLNTPPRFGIATMGDPDLSIFDKIASDQAGIPQEEFLPQNNGYGLARIVSSEHIQGWCG